MKDIPNLGGVPEVGAKRDAIHVAVVPLEAGEDLHPAERVKWGIPGKTVVRSQDGFGIVDPYRSGVVPSGQRVWICLNPGTVTSLRHEWEHPAFDGVVADSGDLWMDAFAKKIGLSVDVLYSAAENYLEYDGHIKHMGSFEGYKDASSEEWKEFWERFCADRGKKIPDDCWSPFSCSC